jgi:uncharacterized membrane protein
MLQSRWKSKLMWATLIAQIIAILSLVGFFQWVGVTEEWVGKVVTAVLEVFVIVGVINDPTNKIGW